jgi:hypothetical protein
MPSIYIDESGYSDILSPRYRFFIMTGVVINDEDVLFAKKLLDHWKLKHSLSQEPGFHAYDLFESNENNANQLRTNRIFSKAIDQLIDILKMIDFKAYCSIIDLKMLRESFHVQEPPSKSNFNSKFDYKRERKKYTESFSLQHGNIKRHLPLKVSLSYLLECHKKELDVKNESNESNGSYINFESLSTNDAKIIEIFHRLQSTGVDEYAQYGREIQGIQFHTKSSLSSGIEIADLISYSVTQSLRGKYKLAVELKTVPKRSLIEVRKIKSALNPYIEFESFPTKKPAK